MSEFVLYDEQQESLDQLLRYSSGCLQNHRLTKVPFQRRVLDLSDLGVGKTAVQIAMMREDHKRLAGTGLSLGTIVMAPKSVLLTTWPDDLKKFAPELTWCVVTWTQKEVLRMPERLETIPFTKVWEREPYDVYLMHFDTSTINWQEILHKKKPYEKRYALAMQMASAMRQRVGRLIIDECTAFAGVDSARSLAMIHEMIPPELKAKGARSRSTETPWFREIFPHLHYIALLSGTAHRKSALSVFSIARVLDRGRSLGLDQYAFEEKYMIYPPERKEVYVPARIGKDGRFIKGGLKDVTKRIDAPGAAERILEALAKRNLILRIEAKGLPAVHEKVIPLVLSDDMRETYNTVKRELTLLDKDGNLQAVFTKQTLLHKLAQIASGAVYNNDSGIRETLFVHTERTDRAVEEIKRLGKVVVFYAWQHQCQQLETALTQAKIGFVSLREESAKRQVRAMAAKFRSEPECQVFLAHPQSCAHGITLIEAAGILWLSLPMSPEHFIQGNRRVCRYGQTRETEIIALVAKNTIDELRWQVLHSDVQSSAEFNAACLKMIDHF
jgi:hypothetical protein